MILPRMALSAVELRKLAVTMSLRGDAPEHIADVLEVDRSSVWRWLKRWREQGPTGLLTTPGQGRRPKLTDRQGRQVLAWLDKSPCDFGFATERWTAPRVAAVIERSFGVHMNHRYLNDWLHRRGITAQVPERRPRERNEQTIRHWVSEDWSRLKKA
jgi:transposase